tara:strand:+ start:342 stop:1238 length:897 start_codon:yes stop_codon:yes gene_type:complete
MMAQPAVSIVVAVEHATQNIAAIIDKINPAIHKEIELIFCFTDADKGLIEGLEKTDNIVLIHNNLDCRIPHLWRDGIRASQANLVALTTAHCIPSEDWVSRLLSIELPSNVAGIGGAIINDNKASAMDWAIYFLRYINYSAPKETMVAYDIAADNAIYNRADIMQYETLLTNGFWEPSFHEVFIKSGKNLRIDPTLVVTHHNAYTAKQFYKQRFEHAKEFGLTRAKGFTFQKRLCYFFMSPVLPLIFLTKIIRTAKKNGQSHQRIGHALPWLLYFLLAWGSGEALGYWEGLKLKINGK